MLRYSTLLVQIPPSVALDRVTVRVPAGFDPVLSMAERKTECTLHSTLYSNLITSELVVYVLTPEILIQVLLTVHADLFDRIPFFCGRHPQFLAQIMPHILLEYYDASEYVMWEGDHSTEMYFVSEGILEVRVRVLATGTF